MQLDGKCLKENIIYKATVKASGKREKHSTELFNGKNIRTAHLFKTIFEILE